MARWFWMFAFYSFCGYLLEKAFAYATHAPQQVRKCFLLWPLCPVYGLGMCAVLLLPESVKANGLWLILCGGVTATAAEYLTHWFYDKAAGVFFWDYSRTPLQIKGRVCLPFALIWGVLVFPAVRYLQPLLETIAAPIPAPVTFTAMLLLTADAVVSLHLLRRSRRVECMSLPVLLRTLRSE